MMVSLRSLLPLQLTSEKVELAEPDKLVTGESSVALSLVEQSELKLMLVGLCKRVNVPSVFSVTNVAVIPNVPPALMI